VHGIARRCPPVARCGFRIADRRWDPSGLSRGEDRVEEPGRSGALKRRGGAVERGCPCVRLQTAHSNSFPVDQRFPDGFLINNSPNRKNRCGGGEGARTPDPQTARGLKVDLGTARPAFIFRVNPAVTMLCVWEPPSPCFLMFAHSTPCLKRAWHIHGT
jgi:hypothetical protein